MAADIIPMQDLQLRAPDNATELGIVTQKSIKTADEQFTKLKEQFKRDARASDKWRRLMKTWYAMRDGDQWDPDTLARMNTQQRAALTFNRTMPVINIVCGIQISNRQDVYVYPRAEGDAQVSEIGTEGVRWFDDRCQADTEESRAFRDAVTCGIGVTETRIDYLGHRDGKGYRERIYPGTAFWDANASKRNLADAKRVWRVKVMEMDEAMELYPDIDPADLDASWTDLTVQGLTEQIQDSVRDYRHDNHHAAVDYTKPVRLVQAQWWEREYQNFVTLPDGREIEVSSDDLRQFRGTGLGIQRVPTKRYYYAIIGKTILQTGPLDPQDGFTFKFMTGQYDEENGYWYGLVKPMADPQQWQNKTLSNIVHLLSTMGKGGLLYETDAFVDPEKAKKEWAKPNPAIELNKGALGGGPNGAPPKFQEKPVGQLPAGLDGLLEFSKRSIYECAGVPFELLSQDVSDQLSGVQEYERKRAGITMLADYFDSLRLYQIQQAELTFAFLRSFFEGQLIRITSDDQQKYVKFALEEDTFDYDFVIDDSPTSPNQKERDWQFIAPVMMGLLQAGVPIPPDIIKKILKASPISPRVIEDILGSTDEEEMTDEERSQQELQMKQIMLQLAKTQSEINKIESEAAENRAQARKALSGSNLDQAKARDLGFQQPLKAAELLHEMAMADKVSPENTTVVDVQ